MVVLLEVKSERQYAVKAARFLVIGMSNYLQDLYTYTYAHSDYPAVRVCVPKQFALALHH